MKRKSDVYEIKPIAYIHTDFPTKFGIPRQGDIVTSLTGSIIFEKEYRSLEAIREIESFSHLWLIWGFSSARKDTFTPTVRPPRLGGNKRVGVFASRSPFRPNSLGLTVVKLEKIVFDQKNSPILLVSGIDMMNNTPIYDIKPYIPYSDCIKDASSGYSVGLNQERLDVKIDEELLSKFPNEKRSSLLDILSLDPRPSYQNNPDRIYGFVFSNFEIKFNVKDNLLTVISVEEVN